MAGTIVLNEYWNSLKQVYLLHVQRFKSVYFNWLTTKQDDTEAQATQLEKKIREYEQKNGLISVQSTKNDKVIFELSKTGIEKRKQALKQEINQLEEYIKDIKYKIEILKIWDGALNTGTLEKSKSFKDILNPENTYGSIEEAIKESPFSKETKKEILQHEKDNTGPRYLLTAGLLYKPYKTYKSLFEKYEKPRIEQLSIVIMLLQEKIARKKNLLDIYSNKDYMECFMALDNCLTAILDNNPNKSFSKSGKYAKLSKIRANGQDCQDLESLKAKIKEIREIVAEHRDTGVIGFFKATWARNTHSLNQIEKSSPIPSKIFLPRNLMMC